VQLNTRTHPVQCCGGEVTLLLELLAPARPSVAIFGIGHVGLALARILALAPIELHLIDTREGFVAPDRLGHVLHSAATVRPQHAPIPEAAVPGLPGGTHVVVMTQDHAEDLHILDMALRRPDLGFLGVIGSSVKWAHFRQKLLGEGHTELDLERITTPIGLGQPSKDPLTIAAAVAAQLLQRMDTTNIQATDVQPLSATVQDGG
jgi:xanthine dehydrogenase accessory factor